jgi:hypothetical protein
VDEIQQWLRTQTVKMSDGRQCDEQRRCLKTQTHIYVPGLGLWWLTPLSTVYMYQG